MRYLKKRNPTRAMFPESLNFYNQQNFFLPESLNFYNQHEES